MIIDTANRINDIKEYYFSRKLRSIASANSNGAQIINIGVGSPDLDPAPEVLDALSNAIKQKDAHRYQPYKGIDGLRKAMANWYKNQYDVTLDPEQNILPLLGSKEGIMHISMSFLQDGDEVLIPNPGYPAYSSAAKLAGAKVLPFHLTAENDYLPDLEFLKKISLRRVKIMWLNYSNMPTGATISTTAMERLVTFAKEEKILLVFDNPYGFILNDAAQSIFSIPGAIDVALELNSLSKMYNMAGWRVGFLAGRKDYIDQVMKFKTNMDSGMFLPIQEAAIVALQLGTQWKNYINGIYTNRRNKVWEILDCLSCTYQKDGAGIFVWAKIPNEYDNAEDFAEYLLTKFEVFFTPGMIFGSNGDQYVRVSLCNEISVYQEVLDRINKDNE